MQNPSLKSLIRPCPICDGVTGLAIYHVRFVRMEDVGLPDTYDAVLCDRCRFAFADTTASQADYDRYYARHSVYEDSTTSYGSNTAPLVANHLAALVTDKNMRIADIGCASGELLAHLHARGFKHLTGIDPSPVCAQLVEAREGMHGLVGTLDHLPVPETPYDLVILTGVLEHVRDLGPALDKLEGILAPQGCCYFAVPDAAQYGAALYAPFQEFNQEHINHFTITGLRNLMQPRGYRTLAAGPLDFSAIPKAEPAIFGLFERGGTPQPLVPDMESERSMCGYVEASQRIMDRLAQQFARYFSEHSSLLLWGTGQLALKLLTLPEFKQERVAAFVDGNPIHHGKQLLGKSILAPEQLRGRSEPILLLTTLHQAPIEARIRSLGLTNSVLTFEITP